MGFAAGFEVGLKGGENVRRGINTFFLKRGLADVDKEELRYVEPNEEDPDIAPHWQFGDDRFVTKPPEHELDAIRAKRRAAVQTKWGLSAGDKKSESNILKGYANSQLHRERVEEYGEKVGVTALPLFYDEKGFQRPSEEVIRDPRFIELANSSVFDRDRNTDGNLVRYDGVRPGPNGSYAFGVTVIDPKTGRPRRSGVVSERRSSDPDDPVVFGTADEAVGFFRDRLRGVSTAFAEQDNAVRTATGRRETLREMRPVERASLGAGAPVQGAGPAVQPPGRDERASLPVAPSTARSAPSVSGTVRGLSTELQQHERALNSPAPDAMAERLGLGGKAELEARVTALKGAVEEQKKAYADPPESFKYKEAPMGAYSDEDAAAARIKAMEGFRKDVALSNALRPDGAALLEATGYKDLADLDAEIEHAKLIEQRLRQGGADRSLPEVPVRPGDAGLAQAGRQWEEVGFPGVGDGIPMGRATTGLGAANVWQEAEAPAPATASPTSSTATDPQVRGILDFIGQHEAMGGQYDIGHAGAKMPANLTLDDAITWGRNWRTRRDQGAGSGAFGRYQFMPDTATELKSLMGLRGDEAFTPELQDAMAVRLLKRRGIDEYQQGRLSAEEFAHNLSQEWAALPQNQSNTSFHGGVGVNPTRAGVSWDETLAAIGGSQNQAPRTQGLASGARNDSYIDWVAAGNDPKEWDSVRHVNQTGYAGAPHVYGDAKGNSAAFDAGGRPISQTVAQPSRAEIESAAAEAAAKQQKESEQSIGRRHDNFKKLMNNAFPRDDEWTGQEAGEVMVTLETRGLPTGPEAIPIIQNGKRITERMTELSRNNFLGLKWGEGTQFSSYSPGISVAATGMGQATDAQLRDMFVTPLESLMTHTPELVGTNRSQSEALTMLGMIQGDGTKYTPTDARDLTVAGLRRGYSPEFMGTAAQYAAQTGRHLTPENLAEIIAELKEMARAAE